MGQLHRYIFRQLVWWTIIVSVSLTCIVWLTQSLRFVEMIVNTGLSVTTFVTFTLLLLPSFLSLIGPIAVFAAVMFTYTKMLNDSEIVILRATGMSPLKIGRPALLLATLVMLLGYLNSIYLMPASFREFKDLQREFRSELSSLFLQEGVFNPVVDGITVFIRERSESGQLFGIIIHDERIPEKPVTMMAEQGAIVSSDKGPRVLMVNGNRQEVREDDGRLSLLYFDRYTFDLSALNKTEIDLWREPRERFLHELFFSPEEAGKIYNYRELRMEGIFRLSSPLLYLAFTAIGLALLLGGDFNRRGQFLRILTAVCCVTAIQVVVLSMKNLGEKTPALEPVMYLVPIIATIGFVIIMISGKPRTGGRKASGKNIPQRELAT
ncbi:MAG: LPS export ABC transporter permease LptF [Alphaproteobacteria bacterium]|nr:LPS export ABC transporter permease LptF [Alphaproteobacteria bacterium]